jgi:pyridoxine 4-dehydrogenase
VTTSRATTIELGDLTVGRIGFGAMHLTGAPASLDRAESMRIARRAVELGIAFIDTADSYDFGANEELLADALHPYPEGLVIATKAGRCNPAPGEWFDLGRPEYLRQQAALSLRRLRVDRIDLFQLHRIDPTVPIADQMGALRQLQEEGKVRHVGLSEVTVEQLRACRRHVDVVSVQNRYHVGDRRHDEVLDYCERAGIAFIPWLPIGGGRHAETSGLECVAADLGASRVQVALAWLLHRSPVMLPIPGTRTRRHLEENAAALRIRFTPEQVEQIARARPAPQPV